MESIKSIAERVFPDMLVAKPPRKDNAITKKQLGIMLALMSLCAFFDLSILAAAHIKVSFSILSVIVASCAGGTTVGILREKWRRDKQMASLVADRLIGKAAVQESPVTTGNSLMGLGGSASQSIPSSKHWQQANQSIGNQAQSNASVFGSILGKSNVDKW